MKNFPAFAFALFASFVVTSSAAEMFPFVLPWDDATPSITNISSWLEKPAGRDGFVTVKDGHLFANGKRLRIFGVNMAFGANFPTHADAEKVAARMAKFGINCVRFHHMDMLAAPDGIWAQDMRTLDPGQLDKLDYFIAELKKNGIYTDLNLHVSRTYPDRPKAEKIGNEPFDKGVDNFCAAMIALQKDYARDLLTHVNTYTKNAYIAEPAVALIEINNENALLTSWHYGSLDTIAAPYREELGALWLKWLREKYPTDEKLTAAWSEGARAAGPEALQNGNFSKGLDGWFFEKHEGATATASVDKGVLAIAVAAAAKEPWHVQFNQSPLVLSANETYAVTFRAKSDAAHKLDVNLGQAHEPWKVIASESVTLSPEWKTFTLLLKTSAADDKARLSISGLGSAAGRYEFADFSLHTAALDGNPPRTAFTHADYAGHTVAAQRDWFAFLWSLEEKYWPGMYAFIREDLQAHSLIVGTQLGWSPFPIQQKMDVIDSHAYWQHPDFHGKGWNADDWSVKNISMAGREDGGTLPGLALQRVAGKPYICTEYSHPAPNEFAAEGFPLLCAYAALQDWDGIFAFAYSHRHDDWDKRYFPSFFDIDQHPVKMATLPASIAVFMRDGQLSWQSAQGVVSISDVMDQARQSGPRIGAEQFGVNRRDAFSMLAGLKLGQSTTFARLNGGVPPPPLVQWDTEHTVATIDASRSKAVVGTMKPGSRFEFVSGGTHSYNGMPRENMVVNAVIESGETLQSWGVIQVTTMDDNGFVETKRILITATGKAANTDMKWTSDAHESVGKNWGRAPSLVEGIAARITLPVSDKKMKAWALDERGQRRDEVPMKDGVLEIGPQYRTLWYEVSAE